MTGVTITGGLRILGQMMSIKCLAVAMAIVGLLAAWGGPSVAQAAVPRFCRVSGAFAALNASRNDGGKAGRTRKAGVLLLLSNGESSRGRSIYARPANFSRRLAGYGAEFRIEKRKDGRWTQDPASPDGPWPRWLGRLSSGDAGRCYRFDIPSEEASGLYRFSTHLYVALGKAPVFRVATFRVR